MEKIYIDEKQRTQTLKAGFTSWIISRLIPFQPRDPLNFMSSQFICFSYPSIFNRFRELVLFFFRNTA